MKRAVWAGLLAGWLLTIAGPAVAQQCVTTGTNQSCTNSIALTGGATGLQDTATATITNSRGATIFGTDAAGTATGISAQNLNLGNVGTVSGSGLQAIGIFVVNDANIVNSGLIAGNGAGSIGYGIDASNDAIVTNSGNIASSAGSSGQAIGILAFRNIDVTNSGTISALSGDNGSSYGLLAGQDTRAMNSGTILSITGDNGSAVGVRGQRSVDLVNSGRIAVTAGAGSQAFGVLANTGTARVVNAGALSVVTGAGSDSYAMAALNGSAEITNSGAIASTAGRFAFGIQTGLDASVTNSGTIVVSSDQQSIGVNAGRNANVVNSGGISASTIGSGFSYGIVAIQDATVSNAGTIAAAASGAGRGIGIFANNHATILNSGTITGSAGTGGQGVGIQVFGSANVTNAGIISGSTAAMEFFNNADTLTVLPGSRIIGSITLGGGGDTVNFRGGNHNLTFDTLAGANVTGTTPFVVSGNRAVAIDATPFVTTGRNLTDFSRAVLDAVPVVSGNSAPGSGALAFAAPDASSRVEDAFAAIPGLSAYSGQGLAFKNPTVVHGDGSAVWARGFAGQRIQQQDGVLLRTANLFYGGMIGGDWQSRPDLRLGVFLGGGQTRSAVDFNQGTTNSDLVFGGAYARYEIGASYVHAAVQAGGSRNAASRIINNNLVAGGLETASATYDGWYVSPEATFGHRWALGRLAGASYTLTPSFRLRYLYGSYAGYTETGTTAPLTVNGQTVSTLEQRGEAKLTRSVMVSPGSTLSTSLTAGVIGTQRIGSTTINAALLGQAIPFATPGQANVWGGLGGLGLEWQTRNVMLFSVAEYFGFTDSSTIVSGRAGLRVAF